MDNSDPRTRLFTENSFLFYGEYSGGVFLAQPGALLPYKVQKQE